ncbi:hypothetical protein LCGC14_2578950, partial [marine sediment metagenome]
MSNGKNEPIEFTRGDSETLVKIDQQINHLRRFLFKYIKEEKETQKLFLVVHESNTKFVSSVRTFRRRLFKIILWIVPSSAT